MDFQMAEDDRNCFIKGWIKVTSTIEHFLESKLERLGKFVGRNPWKVILMSIIFVGICCIGVTNFYQENNGSKLWIPQESVAALHNRWLIEKRGYSTQSHQIIMFANDDKDNAATIESIRVLFDLHDLITSTEKQGFSWNGNCFRNGVGLCTFFSPIQLWANSSREVFEAELARDGGNTDQSKQAWLMQRMSGPLNADGTPVIQQAVFGKQKRDENKVLTTMTAMKCVYTTENSVKDWERAIRDEVLVWRDNMIAEKKLYRINLFMSEGMDDELDKSVGNDIHLMGIAYFLMGIFLIIALKRIAFSLSAIFGIILATVAAYGFCMAIDVPFTSLCMVLPFILVGNGVDDILVVTALLKQAKLANPGISIEDRMGQTFKKAGLTITVTSFTNVSAFFMGVLTAIPAIEFFCVYAAISSLFIWAFQLTFIASCLAIDERRHENGKKDCLCCLERTGDEKVAISDKANIFMREKYGGVITNSVVKVFVILIFAGIFVVNILSIPHITQGFDLKQVTPDDSYMREFLTVEVTKFDNTGYGANGVIKDIDYHTKESQQGIEEFVETITTNEYFTPTAISWYHEFKKFYNNTPPFNANLDEGYITDKATFYQALNFVLENSPAFSAQFGKKIAFKKDGDIDYSEIAFFHRHLENSTVETDALAEAHAIDDKLALNSDGNENAFTFGFIYTFWEQFLLIYGELITSYVYSGIAIFFICAVLMAHPFACILVTAVIAMIDVDLLGALYLYGLDLNSVSVINLIMSIGFITDYSTHFMHAFLHTKGTRNQRVKEAYGVIGPSVLLGGFTTLLGVLPLAFATAEVFRIFFKMFLAIVFYGVIHGMIFLPVVLSLIGPYVHIADKETKVTSVQPQDKEGIEFDKDNTQDNSNEHII